MGTQSRSRDGSQTLPSTPRGDGTPALEGRRAPSAVAHARRCSHASSDHPIRAPTRADPRARPRGARHVSVHVVRGHDWSMMQWSRGHTREAVARRMRARDASEPRRGSATFVHFASVDRSIDALVRVGSTRARGGRRRTFAGASWCWRPSARVDCVEDETRAHASAR